MRIVKRLFAGPMLCLGLAALGPQSAKAYPIDCAILLCMGGGFPGNPVCNAARAEVIRRITPWPVEPPLQLWNCPMHASAAGAASTASLPPEVTRFRDAIVIYDIRRYARYRTRDGEQVVDNTYVGRYSPVTGQFFWSRASFEHGPEWLGAALGARRTPITECVQWHGGDNDFCVRYRIIGYENRYAAASGVMGMRGVRAVVMQMVDQEGATRTEAVRY